MDDHDGDLCTVDELLAVRDAKTEDQWELFTWYHDELVAVAAGKEWWDADRRHYKILQCTEEIDGKPNKNPVTAGTEAFIVLCFESNMEKWTFMHSYAKKNKGAKWPSTKEEPKMKAIYTEPTSGKKKHGGWSIDGLKRFEELRTEISKKRKEEANNEYKQENECLRRVREKHQVTWKTPEEAAKAKGKVDELEKEVVLLQDDEEEEFLSSDEESGDDEDDDDEEDTDEDEEGGDDKENHLSEEEEEVEEHNN